ncbi:hypothetical protein I8751_13425 [Nostocaceae cyanobacterium CENA357]|uniref:Uncharacterized protein n=1 Tax=Atlanticothrix silvestris CENA357 TaxID=1725252 RepID=A0A8J7HIU7_9CYAN|nr:hypothetical protein [Atlanticothrix silvestris]MBH8553356.1 hypothetical protein [Atlanticothrix silvestris CENA357]
MTTQFWVLSRLASAFEKIGTTIFATDIGNGWPLLPNKKKQPSPKQPTPRFPKELSIPDNSEERPPTNLQPIPDRTEERSARSDDSSISFQIIYKVYIAVKSQSSCWQKEIWV